MKCAIMQPTYMPWIGYFDMMDQVDVFILLDNVQFSAQSWQQRNRIKTPRGLQWITVPIIKKHPQRINEVQVADLSIHEIHKKSIQMNYARSKYFFPYFIELAQIMAVSVSTGSLLQINKQLIEYFCTTLGTITPMILASQLDSQGSRSERLVNLCKAVNATTYISPLGSKAYLINELQEFHENRIAVFFHHYEHPLYNQLFPPFIPQASSIDLLFNEGKGSLDIIRSGRRPLLSVSEVEE